VTLSYRSDKFSRIKERNRTRIDDCIRSGKIKVLFHSSPVEFKPETVVIDVQGQRQELSNDYVWIFAGGIPPNDFLKKIGVQFGMKDMTAEASTEAQRARALAKQAATS
jgi:thioredoxin reductase